MAKPIPQKNRKKQPASKPLYSSPEKGNEKSRVWVGVDLSLNTVAIAGLGYDAVLDKYQGPAFKVVRWRTKDHYFDRIKQVVNSHNMVLDVIGDLGAMLVRMNQVFVAIEEPWPMGMEKTGNSNALKQQAELNGAFMGGLLKFGYNNLYQIHNQWWKKIIADSLGITTHYSKYGKGVEGKMRSKEWAQSLKWDFEPVPHWPDLIPNPEGGMMPIPDDSKAKPKQPDDRYDALAMAVWMRQEVE